MRDAVFYSLAFGGSGLAPVQLVRSLESLRLFDRDTPVFVFLFGQPPLGFIDVLQRLGAQVRHLGDYRAYVERIEPDRGELFALDLKLHRWLVLEESELKACERLLYIDSDTLFFGPARAMFSLYRGADLYAREEPCCRRSPQGYDPAFLDEEAIADLARREGVEPAPPFNTGVCLFTRDTADAITAILPRYFDYFFRFLAWFHLHPREDEAPIDASTRRLHERFLAPAAASALPYPSRNRWIADQIGLWLALGQFPALRFADFSPADVWQGGEFQQFLDGVRPRLLCHYFGSNTMMFFDYLQRLPASAQALAG